MLTEGRSDPDQLLDEKQLAQRLCLTVSALQRWRLKGGGPPYFKLGSAVRYRLTEVDAWVAARRVSSTSMKPPAPVPQMSARGAG